MAREGVERAGYRDMLHYIQECMDILEMQERIEAHKAFMTQVYLPSFACQCDSCSTACWKSRSTNSTSPILSPHYTLPLEELQTRHSQGCGFSSFYHEYKLTQGWFVSDKFHIRATTSFVSKESAPLPKTSESKQCQQNHTRQMRFE